MKTLRLVLATDHSLFRAGLRCLLEGLGRVKVVAETGNGREAVVLAKSHRPGLVVIESELAELNGIEAMSQILHFSPMSRIIMVASDGDDKAEARAREAGAAGVLTRSATTTDLERLLRRVRDGRGDHAPDSGAERARVRRPKSGRAGSSPLTPRQYEVLKLLAEGSGVKRIARILGISPKTVETHRAQVMERLHIYDLVGLVRYALREKITRL
ncbi:MAG TPA: response regulator transcription factor [Planctomycetota bacterium]|nr:response regulator transcription factor [Planctomycetota bacterium]